MEISIVLPTWVLWIAGIAVGMVTIGLAVIGLIFLWHWYK